MKRYFWLLYLLLVTVAAALAAQIVNAYISAQLAAPLKPTQTQASRAAGPLAQRAPLTHYEIINKRNIFNAAPPSDTPEPPRTAEPPPPPLEVPATPLPLKLVGIMAGKQAQAPRFAIIESTGNPPGQAVYQVGDSVQQVFIVDILPGCVVLDRGGGQQKLCFEKERRMPLFMIERNFAEQLEVTRDNQLKVAQINDDVGVQWLFSFLSADKKKTYCLYEAPSAEEIREAARRANIPADEIVEVGELRPEMFGLK